MLSFLCMGGMFRIKIVPNCCILKNYSCFLLGGRTAAKHGGYVDLFSIQHLLQSPLLPILYPTCQERAFICYVYVCSIWTCVLRVSSLDRNCMVLIRDFSIFFLVECLPHTSDRYCLAALRGTFHFFQMYLLSSCHVSCYKLLWR